MKSHSGSTSPVRSRQSRSNIKTNRGIVSTKVSQRELPEEYITTFVRKTAGPTEGYIDMMVTPYTDPLTIDDIEPMRFTPERERRD